MPGNNTINQAPIATDNYLDVSLPSDPDMDIKDAAADIYKAGADRTTELTDVCPWYTGYDIHYTNRGIIWDVGSDQLGATILATFTLDNHLIARPTEPLTLDVLIIAAEEKERSFTLDSIVKLIKQKSMSFDVHVALAVMWKSQMTINAHIVTADAVLALYGDAQYTAPYSVNRQLTAPLGKDVQFSKRPERGTQDVLIYYRNMSGHNLRDVTIEPIESVSQQSGDQTQWWKLAKTQNALDTAQPGAALTLGDFDAGQTDTLWARIAVPHGQVAGNYTDVALRVQAEIVGLPPTDKPFSIDVVII